MTDVDILSGPTVVAILFCVVLLVTGLLVKLCAWVTLEKLPVVPESPSDISTCVLDEVSPPPDAQLAVSPFDCLDTVFEKCPCGRYAV